MVPWRHQLEWGLLVAKSSKAEVRTIKPPVPAGKISMAKARSAVEHVFARKSAAASALASGKRSADTAKRKT
jgi:hypothetical protein